MDRRMKLMSLGYKLENVEVFGLNPEAEISLYNIKQQIVQIYVDAEPFLYGKSRGTSHAEIINRFLAYYKFWRDEEIVPDKVIIKNLPPQKFGKFELVGAGQVELDLEKRIATFGGMSGAYVIGINKEHLERIAAYLPDWKLVCG